MICPKCGMEGKRRAYVNHEKYAYIRFEHWNGLQSWHCHIGQELLDVGLVPAGDMDGS